MTKVSHHDHAEYATPPYPLIQTPKTAEYEPDGIPLDPSFTPSSFCPRSFCPQFFCPFLPHFSVIDLMPIVVHADVRRLSQEDFGDIAYRVMGRVFDLHNEMGRLFNERIYHRAVAAGIDDAVAEVQVEVLWETFRKEYFVDLLVGGGGVFEFKPQGFFCPPFFCPLDCRQGNSGRLIY